METTMDDSNNNAVKQELIQLSQQWAEAMVSNDATRIGSFMTDDWVMVSDRGIAGKEHFLAFVSSGDLTHESFKMVGDARIRVFGEAAVLTARVTNTAHYKGQRFDADEWTSDVFVKRDGKWLCVHTHITA